MDLFVAPTLGFDLLYAFIIVRADKFRQASDSAAKLTALKGTDSWKRDDFIKDTGYATFPGSEYDRKVAEACVELLTQVK